MVTAKVLAVVGVPTMAMVRAFCFTVARVTGIGAADCVMQIRRAVERAAGMPEGRARTVEETAWLLVRL
jgi:hypothetical protein